MNVCLESNEMYFTTLMSVTENTFYKLNKMYEDIELEHATNMTNIELKIMTESGTDDDYRYLCEAEAKESVEKKKGIIARMGEAILRFFTNIKHAIFGKPEDEIVPEELPEPVTLPADPKDVMKKGDEIMEAMGQFMSNNKGKVVGVLTGAIGTFSAYRAGRKLRPLVKTLRQYSDKFITKQSSLNKKFSKSKMSPEDMNIFQKGMNKLNEIRKAIGDIIKAIPHMSDAEFKKMKDANTPKGKPSVFDKFKKSSENKGLDAAQKAYDKAAQKYHEYKNIVDHYEKELESHRKSNDKNDAARKKNNEKLYKDKAAFDKVVTYIDKAKYNHILKKDPEKITDADRKVLNKLAKDYGKAFTNYDRQARKLKAERDANDHNIDISSRSLSEMRKKMEDAQKEMERAEYDLNVAKANK